MAFTQTELDKLKKHLPDYVTALKTRYWWAQEGPQLLAAQSKADILLFGGAAGGGKSSLLCGLSLTQHKNSVIYRREATQLTGLLDEIEALVKDDRKGFNSKSMRWNIPDGRIIDFGACPNIGDEQRHQGKPHDLICFDELTHFAESQFRFLLAWNRTTKRGQRCRVVCASNPPCGADSAEGRWLINYWAPWLDPNHPNPAKPCELRWFITIDGKDKEMPDGSPMKLDGMMVRPQSRTFIPSKVTDNAYLKDSGYLNTLHSLPEPLRSQLLHGDFLAGREDQANQVLPEAWVDKAMARWQPRDVKGKLSALGVDPSRGGRDLTIIAKRHGWWFDTLKTLEGEECNTGGKVAKVVLDIIGHEFPAVCIDANGIGASAYDFLQPYLGNNLEAFMSQGRSEFPDDATGVFKFINRRAEAWWQFREMLDPATGINVCLPRDEKLRADLCAPTFELTARGLQIESKEFLSKRLKRSPDRGDAVVYCSAIRRIVMR